MQQTFSTCSEHISFSIEHRTFEDEACSRQYHDCDPIIGGIKVANHDSSFSLGLPVQKNWLEYGFIVAGHSAANGSSLYQPSLSNSYKIGVDADSRYISDCDCAYVKKSTWATSDSSVWRSPNNYLTISFEASARPAMGTQVVLFGGYSGFQQGEVTNPNYSYTRYNVVQEVKIWITTYNSWLREEATHRT